MLTANRATPGDDLCKEFVQCRFGAPGGARLAEIHHHIGVDIAVASVAETGNPQSVFLLESGGKLEKVFQAAARHHNVLVEFGQTRVAQSVGEFAADIPNLIAAGGTQTAFTEQ